jgi:hypothetical protein
MGNEYGEMKRTVKAAKAIILILRTKWVTEESGRVL